jgi:hypothetical protein
MNGDYWLGVATPFALLGVLWLLRYPIAWIVRKVEGGSWFVYFHGPIEPYNNGWDSKVDVERKFKVLYFGKYWDRHGGSNWVAIPGLTVGRVDKSMVWDDSMK